MLFPGFGVVFVVIKYLFEVCHDLQEVHPVYAGNAGPIGSIDDIYSLVILLTPLKSKILDLLC